MSGAITSLRLYAFIAWTGGLQPYLYLVSRVVQCLYTVFVLKAMNRQTSGQISVTGRAAAGFYRITNLLEHEVKQALNLFLR